MTKYSKLFCSWSIDSTNLQSSHYLQVGSMFWKGNIVDTNRNLYFSFRSMKSNVNPKSVCARNVHKPNLKPCGVLFATLHFLLVYRSSVFSDISKQKISWLAVECPTVYFSIFSYFVLHSEFKSHSFFQGSILLYWLFKLKSI